MGAGIKFLVPPGLPAAAASHGIPTPYPGLAPLATLQRGTRS